MLRLLDLRSDHAAERDRRAPVAVEPNPEMGLHGARWLLGSAAYRDALHAVLGVLHDRLGDARGRVHLSVPFLTDDAGVPQLTEPPPATGRRSRSPRSSRRRQPCTPPRRLCAAGASELFLGTKDLAQFYLAADRNNHLVAESYQTRHPAVLDGVRPGHHSGARRRHAGAGVRPARGPEHYLDRLPTPDGYMMCTAELQRMILQSR